MYGTKKTLDLGKGGKSTIREGAMTAAAKREGESNSEYEQSHKDSPGIAGKRARLAIAMKGWKH